MDPQFWGRAVSVGLLIYSWTISVLGVVYVAGHSQISLPIRAWIHDAPGTLLGPRRIAVELVECPVCLGAWLGAAGGYLAADRLGVAATASVVVGAAYTAGAMLILGRATGIMPSTTNPEN